MKISKKIMIVLFMVGVGLSFNLSQGGLVDKVQANQEAKTCYDDCPTVKFEASRWECPESSSAYTSHNDHKDCKKKINGNWRYADKVKETFKVDVVYGTKSEDRNHCHKPTGRSIGVPSWAEKDFEKLEQKLDRKVIACPSPEPVCEQTSWTCGECQQTLGKDICYQDHMSYCQEHFGCRYESACNGDLESRCSKVWVCKDTCEEPSPEPTPTPTSNDEVSYKVLDVKCGSDTVSASVHVKHDNIDQSGIRVLFKYIDQEKIAYTGNDGQASVGFPYIVDGHVDILPDGFPSKQGFTTKEKNCEITETPSEGQVLGASTGEVLGAYAETGVAEDILMSLVGFSGAALTATGAVLNARKNS